MIKRVLTASFVALLTTTAAHAENANLPFVTHPRVTFVHDGTRCLEFKTDQTGDLLLAIDTHPSPIVGTNLKSTGGRAVQANDVIAHFLANRPFASLQYDNTIQYSCEDGDGFPVLDLEDNR